MKNQKRNTTNEENNPAIKRDKYIWLVIIKVITITEKMNKTLLTEIIKIRMPKSYFEYY